VPLIFFNNKIAKLINAIILLSIAMAIATFREENPFETRAKGEDDETLDVLEE